MVYNGWSFMNALYFSAFVGMQCSKLAKRTNN
jgi:hypothetical protein